MSFNLFDIKTWGIKGVEEKTPNLTIKSPFENASPSASWNRLFNVTFDGEKNSGEIGPALIYDLDYKTLRARSWQAYLESEIAQTVINRYVTWIVGKGLKLQVEPVKEIIDSEGITVDYKQFITDTESLFKVYSTTKMADYKSEWSLNQLAKEVVKNAIVGGDCLVIIRQKNGNPTVQIIDGGNIETPFYNESKGKNIKNGIETDSKGKVIAYWVKNTKGKYQRVSAYGAKTGKRQAFLVYGQRYRLDDNRGIPLITTVLETLKKLDRYKEATVGSAEERAKIAYFIEHGITSTGENPMLQQMAKVTNVSGDQPVPVTDDGQVLADKVAATTNKQIFNMPQDSRIKAVDIKQELTFRDFFTVNIDLVSACLGMPPEVAMSKYDSNFSASRAALKDWEHTVLVGRDYYSYQFHKRVYSYWFDTMSESNLITPTGYMTAIIQGNKYVEYSFKNCRFVGANIPHIDPLKEVEAERAKLGELGKHIPLTTPEKSTENLNGGEFDANAKKYVEAIQMLEKLGLKVEPKENNQNTGTNE